MKRIIVSVTNDLSTDQRVQRVCLALHQSGYEVFLVGCCLPDSPGFSAPYKFHRMKLLFRRGVFFYADFNLRLFLLLLFKRFDILIANDLDTLTACFFISRLRRKSLLLDCHEYFPETPEVYQRKFVRNFWLGIERLFMQHLSGYYTVSAGIAASYYNKYGISFEVIRNVPYYLEDQGMKEKEELIIYQGSINMGRGLELMMDAMERLPGYRLLIAGIGPELEKLKNRVKEKQLEKQVVFAGLILPSALKELTATAAVGVSLEEPMGQSYIYSLPNKLFDYIQARVPVLVSDLPEMKAVVEHYQIGEVLKVRTADELASCLTRMTRDTVLRQRWHENLDIAAHSLCWEQEVVGLLQLVESCKNHYE